MKHLTILALVLFLFSCENQPKKIDSSPEKPTQSYTPPVSPKEVKTTKPEEKHISNVPENPPFDFVEFYDQFQKKAEVFSFENSQSQTIKCKEGTVLQISPNSFESEDGKTVNGTIELRIKEFYKVSDMLLANLSTMSNDKILVSGGMLNIEAYSNGKKCKLKSESHIEISFPESPKKEEMQLFYGEKKGNNLNWVDPQPQLSPKKTSSAIIVGPEIMAEFPGGDKALFSYLKNNLYYPISALDSGHQGTVFVSFVVLPTGNITDVSVINGVSPILDKAAYQFISDMPRWIPAVNNRERVASIYRLPVKFVLPKIITAMLKGKAQIHEKIIEDTEVSYNQDIDLTKYKYTPSEQDQTSIEEISYVSFKGSLLDWINCDRFMRSNLPLVNYNVPISSPEENVDIKLLFKNEKAILAGNKTDKGYLFKNIPLGSEVIIVALKQEKEQYYLSLDDTKIEKARMPSLNYRPITIKEFKDSIDQLNR